MPFKYAKLSENIFLKESDKNSQVCVRSSKKWHIIQSLKVNSFYHINLFFFVRICGFLFQVTFFFVNIITACAIVAYLNMCAVCLNLKKIFKKFQTIKKMYCITVQNYRSIAQLLLYKFQKFSLFLRTYVYMHISGICCLLWLAIY